jgi:hypothetical protein
MLENTIEILDPGRENLVVEDPKLPQPEKTDIWEELCTRVILGLSGRLCSCGTT